MEQFKVDSIEDALKDFKEGKFVIVVDDEDRENEGDLIIAAEKITPEKVNFMLKNARGVLCAPITLSRCEELDLPRQVEDNTSVLGTPFTVTIDKLEGCSTGVSAHDRAATIRALADPASTSKTFGRPGHINPLYAQDHGVLRRKVANACHHVFDPIVQFSSTHVPIPLRTQEPKTQRLSALRPLATTCARLSSNINMTPSRPAAFRQSADSLSHIESETQH